MRILLAIDDTDNLESIGTGKLAAMIMKEIEERGWGVCDPISRHQLFVHDDIPYTSHNSAMCFAADIDETVIDDLIEFASEFLAQESAEGSDPGLCVVPIGRISQPELLIGFGNRAKREVLTKREAYEMAGMLGIHLSEHGGTGGGVIGALAGTGLRLGGNDGRFRGRIEVGAENSIISVGDIRSRARVDLVKTLDGECLGDDVLIRLGDKVKAVLQEGRSVILVYPGEGPGGNAVRWATCTKEQLKRF